MVVFLDWKLFKWERVVSSRPVDLLFDLLKRWNLSQVLQRFVEETELSFQSHDLVVDFHSLVRETIDETLIALEPL